MAAISEMDAAITLKAGPLAATFVPSVGGSLSALRMMTGEGLVDLMRPLSSDRVARRNPVDMAMFPMVPYANRIADNSFTFEGHAYRFAANNPPERFNVHGTAWHKPWRVTAQDRRHLTLALRVEEPDLYSYEAQQLFALDGAGLSVSMILTNRGERAMPFGFGQHPWFPRDPDTELRFTARHFWLEGPDGVASDRITIPPELDFSNPRPLPKGWRNNCYGGWDGRVEIRFPSRGARLVITADPAFGHLMFYADLKQPFFCLEPQTNASGALDRLDEIGEHGLIVLAPGESASGGMRFAVDRM